jgi:hypothetical protein
MQQTFGAHAEVDSFHNVDEGFILFVLDITAPPARCPGHRICEFRRLFLTRSNKSVEFG